MSEVSMTELSKELRHAITALETSGDIQEVGVVVRVGDGVAWVHGLRKAGYSEVLEIETEDGVVEAFALNLLEDEIGAVLLGEDAAVKAGQSVKLKGTILDVPVGPELLGRVVDPLGRPLDGGPGGLETLAKRAETDRIAALGQALEGVVPIEAIPGHVLDDFVFRFGAA